ncbi:hypothetical protein ACTFIU_007340 [Dictyostelium citrinum]
MQFFKKQFFSFGSEINNNIGSDEKNNETKIEMFDPRSPSKSIKRTPFKKNYSNQAIFDPRSPSNNRFKRSPIQLNKINNTTNNNNNHNNNNKNKNNNTLIDPRSPPSNNRFKRSPIQIKPKKQITLLLFDPRSPSTKFTRTPIKMNFDPRSPSLKISRTPIHNLKNHTNSTTIINNTIEETCSTPFTKSLNQHQISTPSSPIQEDTTVYLSFKEMLENEIKDTSDKEKELEQEKEEQKEIEKEEIKTENIVNTLNVIGEEQPAINNNDNNHVEIVTEPAVPIATTTTEDDIQNVVDIDSLIMKDLKEDFDSSLVFDNQLSRSSEVQKPIYQQQQQQPSTPLNLRLSKLQKSKDVFRSSPSLLLSPSKRLSIISSSPKPIRNIGSASPSVNNSGSSTPTKRFSIANQENNNNNCNTSSNNLLGYFSCDNSNNNNNIGSIENNPNSFNKIISNSQTPTKRLSTLGGSGGMSNSIISGNLTPTKRNPSIHKMNLSSQKHSSTSNLTIYH